MQGLIALDIDGTLTHEGMIIPDEVVAYLEQCVDRGWKIAFITGRSLTHTLPTVESLPFPFALGLQNGADLLNFPGKQSLARHYLSKEILIEIEAVFNRHEEEFFLYSGWEMGDFCYGRFHNLNAELQQYHAVMREHSTRPWQAVQNFAEVEQESFPMVKTIGSKERMDALCHAFQGIEGVCAQVILAPRTEGGKYLFLVSHARATKGHAAKEVQGDLPKLIVAGDDVNDLPMFRVADISIAMGSAPQMVKDQATIIAPPSKDRGIIQGLEKAFEELC